jgi:hypothetical protein
MILVLKIVFNIMCVLIFLMLILRFSILIFLIVNVLKVIIGIKIYVFVWRIHVIKILPVVA